MSYKIGILALVALQALTTTALAPCVCTRNLRPVCGSDGVTYANECLLNCEQYKGKTDLTVKKEGPCETECICPLLYSPVCGNDGNTYPNRCTLVCKRSENPNVDVVSEGPCGDEIKVTEPCICTEEIDEVCGSDGNTYINPCNLNCEKAKNPSLGLEHKGKCVDAIKVAEPPCICTDDLREVCGTDGKTYGNPCLLNCATAKDNTLGIKSEGKCEYGVNVVNPIQGDQPICSCPRNLKPVCGSDGVTYNNECLLRCAGADVSFARHGPCSV